MQPDCFFHHARQLIAVTIVDGSTTIHIPCNPVPRNRLHPLVVGASFYQIPRKKHNLSIVLVGARLVCILGILLPGSCFVCASHPGMPTDSATSASSWFLVGSLKLGSFNRRYSTTVYHLISSLFSSKRK